MQKEKIKFNKLRFIIISLIFLLIIFSIGKTNSRYLSGASSDTDLIAKTVLTLNNNKLTYTEENLLPRRYKNI